jgi:hypothetical protein
MQNIVVQVLWFIVAVWFLYSGYQANKKAPKSGWKQLTTSTDFDSLFMAGRIVTGAGIIVLLVLKLLLQG